MQSGVVDRIQEALDFLKQLNSSKDIGKGNKSVVKGSKKVVITDAHGEVHGEPVGQTVVVSKRVLQLLHQHSTSNQNVLHICCSNPTFVEDRDGIQSVIKNSSKGTCIAKLDLLKEITNLCLLRFIKVVTFVCFSEATGPISVGSKSSSELSVDVRGLQMLLNDSVFAKEFVPMVRPFLFSSNFQLNGKSNPTLHWFCLTSFSDLSMKVLPPSQPIRLKNETNRDLSLRFPALLGKLPIFLFFKFSLAPNDIFLCSD